MENNVTDRNPVQSLSQVNKQREWTRNKMHIHTLTQRTSGFGVRYLMASGRPQNAKIAKQWLRRNGAKEEFTVIMKSWKSGQSLQSSQNSTKKGPNRAWRNVLYAVLCPFKNGKKSIRIKTYNSKKRKWICIDKKIQIHDFQNENVILIFFLLWNLYLFACMAKKRQI